MIFEIFCILCLILSTKWLRKLFDGTKLGAFDDDLLGLWFFLGVGFPFWLFYGKDSALPQNQRLLRMILSVCYFGIVLFIQSFLLNALNTPDCIQRWTFFAEMMYFGIVSQSKVII